MIINMNGAKAPETPSSVLQEKTVTPETLPIVIGADEGYDGLSQVTVNPDAQLKAENIRSGKTIFGVTGSFVGTPQIMYSGDLTAVTLGSQSISSITINGATKEAITLDSSAEYIIGDNRLFNSYYAMATQDVAVTTVINKYSRDYLDKRTSTNGYHVVFTDSFAYGLEIPMNVTGLNYTSVEVTAKGNFKLYVYMYGTAGSNMAYGTLLDIGEQTLTSTKYAGNGSLTEQKILINFSVKATVDTIIPVGYLGGSISVVACLLPDNVVWTTRRV